MENPKEIVAKSALRYITSGDVVGLGTGTTASEFIKALGASPLSKEVTCVPTSLETESLAKRLGLNLVSLNSVERIDITVDGADEVDNNKNLLKGGGGALTREKIVAHYSKRYVIVITEEKLVENLGSRMPIPVEVLPFSYVQIIRELNQMGLSCQLRKNFTTDNGNYIIDCKPNQKVLKGSLQDLNKAIKLLPGVVETGIFINFNPEILYHKNGQVLEIK